MKRALSIAGAVALAACGTPQLDFRRGGASGGAGGTADAGATASALLGCPTVIAPAYTLMGGGRVAPELAAPARVSELLARGLTRLRQPDAHGNACAHCHSPDGIELAAVAFTDEDVLRHARRLLDEEGSRDVVDYVHALRVHHAIARPCSKAWRPFQPGGEPLPGEDVAARELAFFGELTKRRLMVVTRPITSIDDARAAAAEIEATDLRTLPVPVAFPRWSEDPDDPETHRSFHDWLPGVGRVPLDPAAFWARHDRYLNDPTIDNAAAIDAALVGETRMAAFDARGRPVDVDFSLAYDAQNWVQEIALRKLKAVLLGTHLLRLALLGKPGYFDRPALPFPELNRAYGPAFDLGLQTAQPVCHDDPACERELTARAPAFVVDELGDHDVRWLFRQLSDPWACLGALYDQSLLTVENTAGPTQDAFYWNDSSFEHQLVQQPFFSAHRLLVQEAYAARYAGTYRYPAALEAASRMDVPPGVTSGLVPLPRRVHPLLHGAWARVWGIGSMAKPSDPRLGRSLFLRANLVLMVAHLQRALLAAGEPVAAKATLMRLIDEERSPARELTSAESDAGWAAANADVRAARPSFVDAARALLDEVAAQIAGAAELPD